MKYIALLRGINVGGNNKVEMKKLKILFESLGCTNVSTYINSGNVIFELGDDQSYILDKFEKEFKNVFGFEVPILFKTAEDIKRIASAIPDDWKNDLEYKTDIAYLFAEIDSKEILDDLPIQKEFVDIRYVQGAVCWRVAKEDYSKSNLNKIVSHKLYKFMTVRNINTARYLAMNS